MRKPWASSKSWQREASQQITNKEGRSLRASRLSKQRYIDEQAWLELTTCLYLTSNLGLEQDGWTNDIPWHCWMEKLCFSVLSFILLLSSILHLLSGNTLSTSFRYRAVFILPRRSVWRKGALLNRFLHAMGPHTFLKRRMCPPPYMFSSLSRLHQCLCPPRGAFDSRLVAIAPLSGSAFSLLCWSRGHDMTKGLGAVDEARLGTVSV